jgi:RNA polymerase sigma-70 factor (ECF subfamily)
MSTPDARLQQRLARGEEAALGELYDRFAPLVHGLAWRILDDQDAAEQLTREVFAHLWTTPAAYRPDEGTLRAWLGALTHRRAVERLRHRYGDGRELAERVAGARAHHIVATLPEPLRDTIDTLGAGRTEDANYRDTARRLGITEHTAKHRMRLGLHLVATELAGDRPYGCPDTVAATGPGRPAP